MSPSLASTHDYCRRARRARHHYRHDPAMKLASLRALAIAHDRAQHAGAECSVAPVTTVLSRGSNLEEFSRRVTCELTGTSILRYSRRVALLSRARRLGIDRFDANLLIAAVQNRAPLTHATTLAAARSRGSWLAPMLAFGVIQSCIVAAAWLVLS